MGLHENMLKEPVSQLALRPAVTAPADVTVRDAVQLMQQKSLGCVLIVDGDNKPLGMFTEGMVRHLLVENQAALDDRVKTHMADRFPWVKLSDPIVTVLDAMHAKNHRFVCVVDEDEKVTALTGQKGLMEYIAEHFPRQILTQPVGVKPPTDQREGA